MFGKNIPPANAAVRQKTSDRLLKECSERAARESLLNRLLSGTFRNAGEFPIRVMFFRGPGGLTAGAVRDSCRLVIAAFHRMPDLTHLAL